MNISDLIISSLEYYDLNINKYNDFNKKSVFSKESLEDNKQIISLYDVNENLLHSSEYDIIGSYTTENNLWTWGWAIPFFSVKQTRIAKRILNYALDIDPRISAINTFIKSQLTTSRFIITNPIQLEMHASLYSYLSKSEYVLKIYQPFENLNPKRYNLLSNTSDFNGTIYYCILNTVPPITL
jgi:hypothetical protein